MRLVQSFISIAESAAKQQACQLNITSNIEAQQQSQQLRLEGRSNDLFKLKQSRVGDKSAEFKP